MTVEWFYISNRGNFVSPYYQDIQNELTKRWGLAFSVEVHPFENWAEALSLLGWHYLLRRAYWAVDNSNLPHLMLLSEMLTMILSGWPCNHIVYLPVITKPQRFSVKWDDGQQDIFHCGSLPLLKAELEYFANEVGIPIDETTLTKIYHATVRVDPDFTKHELWDWATFAILLRAVRVAIQHNCLFWVVNLPRYAQE
jgi:hypothetical protein